MVVSRGGFRERVNLGALTYEIMTCTITEINAPPGPKVTVQDSTMNIYSC